MNSLFTNFGKFALFTLLGIGIVLGGYIAATRFNSNPEENIVTPANISVTPVVSVKPTEKKVLTEQITAGSSVYSEYTMLVPTDWQVKVRSENNNITNITNITKGEYALIIVQTARGGQPCSFTDAPFPTSSNSEVGPAEPSKYTDYKELKGLSGDVFRRVQTQKTAEQTIYGVCQKNQDGSYFIPTAYGEITYETPLAQDPVILSQMDLMVKSLKDLTKGF